MHKNKDTVMVSKRNQEKYDLAFNYLLDTNLSSSGL